MRLDAKQIAAIRATTAAVFGAGAQVRLFGSRVDDGARGGDIDLMVSLPRAMQSGEQLRAQRQCLVQLQLCLGEQKIDLVVAPPEDDRSIVKIARETGILL